MNDVIIARICDDLHALFVSDKENDNIVHRTATIKINSQGIIIIHFNKERYWSPSFKKEVQKTIASMQLYYPTLKVIYP